MLCQSCLTSRELEARGRSVQGGCDGGCSNLLPGSASQCVCRQHIKENCEYPESGGEKINSTEFSAETALTDPVGLTKEGLSTDRW